MHHDTYHEFLYKSICSFEKIIFASSRAVNSRYSRGLDKTSLQLPILKAFDRLADEGKLICRKERAKGH